jgi:CheY-like chemotaxis protein
MDTLLVIEDEEELREMMREALELNGYSVVTAVDGRDALDKLSQIDQLCLVILDLLMPGMNGWDFLEEWRQHDELASIPVVVHTSARDHAPAGATRILQKPVVFEHLLSTVREFCAPR